MNKNWHKMNQFAIFVDAKKYQIMKQFYIIVFTILAWFQLSSQTTLATTHTFNTPSNVGMGFQIHVSNTNSYPVRVFRINSQNDAAAKPLAHTVNVWYKPNATNAAPGAITTANGWVNAGSFAHNQKFNSIVPYISNLAIDIPANSTYRIWIFSTNITGLDLLATAGVNTFSTAGVDLLTGDSISWWGTSLNGTNANPLAGFVGSIEFYPLVTCTGTPEVGSIVGDISSCNGEAKFYYLQGYVPGNGITYQWQISTTTPTGTYTNIGTNTTMLARTHGATNEYIRCIATCGTSRDTTPIFADTLKPFYHCYCQSDYSDPDDTKIDSVVFGNIRTGSLSSTCETYTDYRSTLPITRLRAGITYPIEVVNGSCSGTFWGSNGAVFVDWNRNGVFETNADRIGTGWTATTLNQRFTSNIAIPLSPASLGITGMRVIHTENTILTNTCGINSFGETEDYLVEIIKDSSDLNVTSINNLEDGCDMGNTAINFTATNIGRLALNPVNVCYSVNGGTPICENFGSLASNATSSYTFTSLANLSGHGKKTIKVWHNNALDTNKTNDTVVKVIYNYPIPPTPTAGHDTVCIGSQSSIIRANSYDSFTTRWYTDVAATNEVGSGNTLTFVNPTSSTTRYAKSVYTVSNNLGPTTISPSTWLFGTGQGLFFNVMRNKVKIKSVKVRFDAAGIAAIEIRNPANTISLLTQSFIVPTANTDITVPLNIELPIGTGYRMIMNTNPGNAAARISYTGFPQTIPNVISITGSVTTSSPPRYDFFFDWDVSYDACSSPVVPVNSVYLTTVNAPIKPLVKDTFYCQYPNVYLDAQNAGATYQWHDGTTNQTKLVTTSGLYIVTITHSSGCKSVDSSDISIRVSPIFSLGNDTTVCAGKSVLLKSGFSNAGYNHVWSNNSLEPNIEVRNPGQYFVNVFNTNTNCGYADTINVNYVASPNAFLGKDTSSCNTSPVIIKAPTGNYNYLWDDGSSGNTRTVNQSGMTKVAVEVTDVSNVYGCKATDTLVVTMAKLGKPNLGSDISTCNVDTNIGVIDSAHLKYKWSNGGTRNITRVTETGEYVLTVTEVNTTCSYSDTINVTFKKNPILDLGDDSLFTCDANAVTIEANLGWTSYNWSNGFSTNKIIVSTPATYTVTATGPCGTVSDSKTIAIQTPVADFNLPEDQVVCDPVILSVPSQPATNTIEWSTGETTTSITVNQTGTYWASISNRCGAKSDAVRIVFDTFVFADFDVNWTGQFIVLNNKSSNGTNYKWEFGDDSTSTEKHPTHLYLDKDKKVYIVKLIVTNSCGDTMSRTKLVNLASAPSGISSVSNLEISIFPNPASNEVTINYPKAVSNDKYNIELMSVEGRVIQTLSQSFNAKNDIVLDLSVFSEGTYLLRIQDENGEFQELKKLIINR